MYYVIRAYYLKDDVTPVKTLKRFNSFSRALNWRNKNVNKYSDYSLMIGVVNAK